MIHDDSWLVKFENRHDVQSTLSSGSQTRLWKSSQSHQFKMACPLSGYFPLPCLTTACYLSHFWYFLVSWTQVISGSQNNSLSLQKTPLHVVVQLPGLNLGWFGEVDLAHEVFDPGSTLDASAHHSLHTGDPWRVPGKPGFCIWLSSG